MSLNLTRSNLSDNYQILSAYDTSFNTTERAIVQSLVSSNLDCDTNIYTSPANGSTWNYFDMNVDYINTSAIFNYPAGSVTENSVLYVDLSNNDASFNTYSTTISNVGCTANNYAFSALPTSSAYYDSNYVVTQSLIKDCFDENYTTVFSFDLSNVNVKSQYAMQSRWNTTKGPYTSLETVGPDPLAVTQDVSFNTLDAFGQKGTEINDASYNSYWTSVDASNGTLAFHLVDASYQPVNNNLHVKDRPTDSSFNLDDDIGIFRIQQQPQIIYTILNGADASLNGLEKTPIFNAYGVPALEPSTLRTDASMNLPYDINRYQFASLFNDGVYDTVNQYWKFNIDISSNGGGYFIDVNHPAVEDLNNSNLLDNIYYMENYVLQGHAIDISSGTVTISDTLDGFVETADSITVGLSYGEKLEQIYAGVNGQIILNTNTPTTRVEFVTSTNVTGADPVVYYSNEDPSNCITGDELTDPSFNVRWQKIAQQTENSPSSDYLVKNSGAILTLYTNQVVDSCYNSIDFDLSFNASLMNPDDINLWRIDIANNVIINPNSLYSDPTYTSLISGMSTFGSLTNITETLNYNNYRILLDAKTLEQINLYDTVQSVNGWSVDSTGAFLESSATAAYSTSEHIPFYSSNLITWLNNGNNLSYSYAYKTAMDSDRPGGLVDYVEVNYSAENPVADPSELYTASYIIPQSQITRTYIGAASTVETPVPAASYSFTGSIFAKPTWALYHVTSDSSYNASFSANYGPFTNVTLTVNDIQQRDSYYAVKNTQTNTYAPQSALQYVLAPLIPDLTTVYETILPAGSNQLTINGTMTQADIKPFVGVVQGQDALGNWVDISQTNNVDVYYGLNNTMVMDDTSNLNMSTEYTPFSDVTNASVNVVLDNQNYYIPFYYDLSNNVYTLTSFNSAISNIGQSSKTTIATTSMNESVDNKWLDVQNNYDVVTNWSSNAYKLALTHVDNDVIFTVSQLSDDLEVFTVKANDTSVFLGTFIISYIPFDGYRADRLLGSNITTTYNEEFAFTNYDVPNNIGYFGLSGIPGVFIYDPINSYTTPINRPVLGAYQSFKVKGDYMSINEVGSTTNPTSAEELGNVTYNDGSNVFQYVSIPINPGDLSYYSATFTFPYYRGYLAGIGDQVYTINRTSTTAKFTVAEASETLTRLVDTLTTNMYYGEEFTVNDLRDASNVLIANLGVSSIFQYSIYPYSLYVVYPVTVIGDRVEVTITNNDYTGSETNIPVDPSCTPVVDPVSYSAVTTLISFGRDDLYTFSGSWYLTNNYLGIRPSRVKLTNSAYPDASLNYYIENGEILNRVYKAVQRSSDISYNWIGNPVQHGSQDASAFPTDASYWIIHTVEPYSDTLSVTNLIDGLNIGSKTLYLPRNLSPVFEIAYYISAAPYYTYEQISSQNCPVIPYDYGLDYSANETVRYYPYTSLESVFNPFAAIVSFTDISGSVTNVTNNQLYLNNVSFDLSGSIPENLSDFIYNPDGNRVSAIVPGTNLSISLYNGSYPNTTAGLGHTNPIYNGPITSISSVPDLSNNIIFRNRDASGAIYFSMLQYPADIGYPSGDAGYELVLHTTDKSNWYNIDMKIGNPSWFNDNSGVTFFNFDATGIFPTLYTVVDQNDPLTQRNFRRVYKYTSPAPVDIDLSTLSTSEIQAFTMTFNERSYCDIAIAGGSFGTSGIWNYKSILEATNIGTSTPITWTTDASYAGTFTYMGWSFGNSTTANNMLVELLSVSDNEQKWSYITLLPFMYCTNQFGVTVSSIAWDGSTTNPLVSARTINLYPAITNPVLLNNTTTIEQYSTSTLM